MKRMTATVRLKKITASTRSPRTIPITPTTKKRAITDAIPINWTGFGFSCLFANPRDSYGEQRPGSFSGAGRASDGGLISTGRSYWSTTSSKCFVKLGPTSVMTIE